MEAWRLKTEAIVVGDAATAKEALATKEADYDEAMRQLAEARAQQAAALPAEEYYDDDEDAEAAVYTDPGSPGGPATPVRKGAAAARDEGAVAAARWHEKERRYEELVARLRKLLETERRRTRQARSAHLAELASRTELQRLLREAVDDVRAEAAAVQQQQQQQRTAGAALVAPLPSRWSSSTARQTSARRVRPQSAVPPPSSLRPSSAKSAAVRPLSAQPAVPAAVQAAAGASYEEREKVLNTLLAKERVTKGQAARTADVRVPLRPGEDKPRVRATPGARRPPRPRCRPAAAPRGAAA